MPANNESEKASQRRLREQMHGKGMDRAEIAAEMARQFRLRPRQAWRAAWGWTAEEAAERYNALRSKDAADAVTSLTGSRLSEWERWPFTNRKPSLLSLCLLAKVYQAEVVDLIDFHDRENLPVEDLVALEKMGSCVGQRAVSIPGITFSPPHVICRVVIEVTSTGANDVQLSRTADIPVAQSGQLTLLPAVQDTDESQVESVK